MQTKTFTQTQLISEYMPSTLTSYGNEIHNLIMGKANKSSPFFLSKHMTKESSCTKKIIQKKQCKTNKQS